MEQKLTYLVRKRRKMRVATLVMLLWFWPREQLKEQIQVRQQRERPQVHTQVPEAQRQEKMKE